MLELYAHPFSSYCWKALIALYENDTPFAFRMVDPDHPENTERLRTYSPHMKFPVLVDDGHPVFETSVIIEYLQAVHPGPAQFIPSERDAAIEVRMLDRFFDNYVMTPMQTIVFDRLRAAEERHPRGAADADAMLQQSYEWLENRLDGKEFICGESFSLADCAAAPSLFYADWVSEIPGNCPALRSYRSRLLDRPSVKRCVDEARPYRPLFPLGAPARD